MKITVTKYMFERAFVDAGRKEKFSYSGLCALFDYIEELEADNGEELEADNGEEIELDVIDICCCYSEYTSAVEAATEYGWEKDAADDENEKKALDWLNDRTQVIPHEEGVIIAEF